MYEELLEALFRASSVLDWGECSAGLFLLQRLQMSIKTHACTQ